MFLVIRNVFSTRNICEVEILLLLRDTEIIRYIIFTRCATQYSNALALHNEGTSTSSRFCYYLQLSFTYCELTDNDKKLRIVLSRNKITTLSTFY